MRILRYPTYKGMFFPSIPWNKEAVVVINNFSLVPILPILAFTFILKLTGFKKAKLVFAPHGGFTPMWEVFSERQRFIKQMIHSVLGVHMINYAVDWIHSVAEWEKEKLIAEGVDGRLITVISNGVEEAGFDDTLPVEQSTRNLVSQSGQYIVAIGRIHPIKNVHVSIRALRLLPKSVNLLILGQVEDPAYDKYIHALIKELQLEDRVKLVGAIRGADKFYILRHAVAMVHPSRYEVDPLVIKEALSQGTICIGADNTGTSRLIQDNINGFLVPTNDVHKLAERVNLILNNPSHEMLLAMRNNNLTHREELRWGHIAGRIEQRFNHFEFDRTFTKLFRFLKL